MKVVVVVELKAGVRDPEGSSVAGALPRMAFRNVEEVRVGKRFELMLDETDPTKARTQTETMCKALLANPVVETYTIAVEGEPSSS